MQNNINKIWIDIIEVMENHFNNTKDIKYRKRSKKRHKTKLDKGEGNILDVNKAKINLLNIKNYFNLFKKQMDFYSNF